MQYSFVAQEIFCVYVKSLVQTDIISTCVKSFCTWYVLFLNMVSQAYIITDPFLLPYKYNYCHNLLQGAVEILKNGSLRHWRRDLESGDDLQEYLMKLDRGKFKISNTHEVLWLPSQFWRLLHGQEIFNYLLTCIHGIQLPTI